MMSKKYYYIILICLCWLVYANALHNDFVSDDVPSILEFPFIQSTGRFLLQPIELTNSICYHIGKFNVVPYHLFNIVMHTINTILVFAFLRLFFKTESSFFGASLFAIHPIHVEAVSWISGKAYLILTFFILSAYLLYFRSSDQNNHDTIKKRKKYLLALLLFTYIVIKNSSHYILFPFLIMLSDCVFGRWRRNWKLWIPFFVIAASSVYLMLGEIAQRITTAPLDIGHTHSSRNVIEYFIFSFFSHLWLLIWPARLTLYHEPIIFKPPLIFFGALLFSFFLYSLPFIYRRAKVLIFGIGIFVLFLAPTFSPWPVASVVAERYLYFPSIALMIFVAFLYEKYFKRVFTKRHYGVIIATGFIFAAFAVRTVARNEDWKSNEIFWRATLRTSPQSPRAHNNMGVVYIRDGSIEKAINKFNIAKRINPKYVDPYNNLGVLYNHIGTERAIQLLEKAIDLNPFRAEAYYNLGNVYRDMWHIEKAIFYYKKATEVSPDYAKAYNNLGNLYSIISRYKEAHSFYMKAIESNPRYADAYYNLGNLYMSVSKIKEAAAMFEQSIALFPGAAPVYSNLGHAYASLGRTDDAVAALQKAIAIAPDYAKAYNNLATIYNANDRAYEAIALLERAIELRPDFASAYLNLAIAYVLVGDHPSAIELCEKARQLGIHVPPDFLGTMEADKSR